jgi:hypothetical protein
VKIILGKAATGTLGKQNFLSIEGEFALPAIRNGRKCVDRSTYYVQRLCFILS